VKTFVKLGNIGTTAHPDYMDFGLPGKPSIQLSAEAQSATVLRGHQRRERRGPEQPDG
jgi:hypothetical protein